MLIVSQPAVLSLSGNMAHVVIAATRDVAMAWTDAGGNAQSRHYAPADDGAIDIDLREIVEADLTFTLQNVSTPYRQTDIVRTFSFTFTETGVSGSSTVTFTAIRAGVDRLAETAANFLTQNFLTWQPSTKGVTYYTPEFLTYYATVQATVKCKAHIAQDNEQTVTLKTIPAGQAYTVPVGYAVIAGMLSPSGTLPQWYDVWVENGSGTRLTYIQRYYADNMRSEQEQWVLFENSLGGIDTFRAYGDSDNRAEHKHNVAEIEEVAHEYRVDTERTFKKSTGRLDLKERLWLLDFFPSCRKYIYVGDYIRQIVVTESEAVRSERMVPTAYSFTYRYADAKPYLNLPRTDVPQEVLNISVPQLGSFTVAPRLVEFPRTQLSGGALFPVQDPYSEGWGTVSWGVILEGVWTGNDFASALAAQLLGLGGQIDTLRDTVEAMDGAIPMETLEQHFVTIGFFNRLFQVLGTGNTAIATNSMEGTVTSLRVNTGLWSQQFISALGLNPDSGGSGGGGDTLLEPLAGINAAGLAAHPSQAGQTIVWSGTAWVYGSVGGVVSVAWADITGKPETFTPSEHNHDGRYYRSGTKVESAANADYATSAGSVAWTGITSKPETFTPSEHNHDGRYYRSGTKVDSAANADYATRAGSVAWTGITSKPETFTPSEHNHDGRYYLSGTKVESAANADYATRAGSAGRLSGTAAHTAWGQTYWQDGVPCSVSGNMTGVGIISMTGYIEGAQSIELNSNANSHASGHGGFIDFHYEGASGDYTSRIIEDASGRINVNGTLYAAMNGNVGIGNAVPLYKLDVTGGIRTTQAIRIGDGLITWDSQNNALKIERINGSSVVAGHLYATGGLSSLGMSNNAANTSILLNVLTVNSLNVGNQLNISKSNYTHNIYGDYDGTLHIDGSENIQMGNDVNMDGFSIYTQGGDVNAGSGHVKAGRFYFDDTRYLYLDGTTLKFYDGSTSKTVVLQ